MLTMATTPASIQDRTTEFKSVLTSLQKRHRNVAGASGARQNLLSDTQRRDASSSPTAAGANRSEFARRAADIGRGITGTMAKLERLAQLATRKTLFDDRPVEIAELTYIIKQDLSALNSSISGLQSLTRMSSATPAGRNTQSAEHSKNVVVLLQGKLADVSVNFKEVLETRTKNIQASRSRTENFVSAVSAHTAPSTALDIRQTNSPLYATPNNLKSGSPAPTFRGSTSTNPDLLSLDPSSLLATSNNPTSSQQLQLMEEGATSNSYISARSEAISAIESTISELGGIFSQLATMVTEQSEMIQRIDANTEDVVDNVAGAQKELMKYWGRVSSNRWLVAKMFGVLMVFFLLWVLIAG